MPTRADLPTVEPQWDTRPITAREIVMLAQGNPVPGTNPEDPRIREIRHALRGNVARTEFVYARQKGYLVASEPTLYQPGSADQLSTLWLWWCVAAGHPYIVIRITSTDAAVRCDMGPTESVWQTDVYRHFTRMLASEILPDYATWTVTRTVFEVTGIDTDSAVGIARDLVDIATAGRFRPEGDGPEPTPNPAEIRSPRMGPMERSDWNGRG